MMFIQGLCVQQERLPGVSCTERETVEVDQGKKIEEESLSVVFVKKTWIEFPF